MRKLSIAILIICSFGCEDQIFPELETNEPIIVVDAWVSNKPEPQYIELRRTQDYFEISSATTVSGAQVSITDENGIQYSFFETDRSGVYEWIPSVEVPVLGTSGLRHNLRVVIGETLIESSMVMGRVPEIDSVSYRFEEGDSFFPDAYFADFWAKDPIGPGDTYWIKAFKNGEFLGKPGEISLAYDAGFSEGGNVDGLVFIQPIRDSINPFEQDENDEFLAPYEPGDSVFVELHSISEDAFKFFNEVIIQSDREGGFAELFAQPLSNVPTNIQLVTSETEEKVIGFFNVAAVSVEGKRLDPNNLPGPRN